MALDVQLFYLFNGLAGRSALLDQIIVFFGSYLPYLVIAVFFIQLLISGYSYREKSRMLLVAFASAAIARWGMVDLIRNWYHRPRPFSALPVRQLLENSEWSFPSGHAAFFFALATAVFFYDRRWGTGLFTAAIFISFARVAAGVHYPSDILGGAVLGILAAWAVRLIALRILSKEV
ncbi:phosphatase PAP2 family protein [Candidatus Kaiserbacteria bacterium]|nr:phosphatase PAP2 family protein [Candidatus Kaiserbacteria bacterium]